MNILFTITLTINTMKYTNEKVPSEMFKITSKEDQ